MTCIVGIVDRKKKSVIIGGDSAGVCRNDILIHKDRKVFKRDGMVFGFTWSFRMGQVLQYDLQLHHSPKGNLHRWMVTRFVPDVRKAFDRAGYTKSDNGREEGGVFLVGLRDRLFTIYSDFQVAEIANGMNAIGCGETYALGSLHSTGRKWMNKDPRIRVRMALEAAEEYSTGVARPFRVVSTNA